MLNRSLIFIFFALAAIEPLSALQQPLKPRKQVTINFQALQNFQPKEQTIDLQLKEEQKDGDSVYYLTASNTHRGQRYLLVVRRLDGTLVIKAPVSVKKNGSLTRKLARVRRDQRIEIPVAKVFPGERMECFLVSENGQTPLAKIGFTPHPIIAWIDGGPSVSANLMDVDAHHYLIRGRNFTPNETMQVVTRWGDNEETIPITADDAGSFRTIFSPAQEGRKGGTSLLTFENSQGNIQFHLPWGSSYYTWAVHVMKKPQPATPPQETNGLGAISLAEQIMSTVKQEQ